LDPMNPAPPVTSNFMKRLLLLSYCGRISEIILIRLRPMGEMVCAKNALSVKLGVLGLGGILMVYGNITAESQSAQRTNERRRLLFRDKYAVPYMCLVLR
jgi:hypothetical protein